MNLKDEVKKKYTTDKNVLYIDEKQTLNKSGPKTPGRKKNDDKTKRSHSNYSSNNIIVKIKGKMINEYLLDTLYLIQKKKFKKVNYTKFISKIKKENNLKLLNTTLNDIISSNTFNSKIIEKINNTNNPEDSLIKEVLKLTLEQWYKYFTYQEEFEFLNNFNNNQMELNKSNSKTIKDHTKANESYNNIIKRADDLLNKIGEKEEGDYLSKFTYHLYNYKKWFITITGRGKEN